jgi:hypothetical protein
LTELSRYYIQDVLRELCNFSFIFFIMSTGTFLWTCALLLIILFTKPIVFFFRDTNQNSAKCALHLLERSCSFIILVDSRFVGIAIFMLSNYFTGVTNLVIRTKSQSDLASYMLIFLNSFVFKFIPFYVIYFRKKLKKTNELQHASRQIV